MNRGVNYDNARFRIKLSHFTEQGYNLNGIVHAGANDGEEMYWYNFIDIYHIIAFEPLDGVFEKLEQDYPAAHCFKLALGNHDGTATLQVTYGDGKGSSIMDPNLDHPEVKANWTQGQAIVVGTQEIQVRRFKTWVEEHPEISLAPYDTLVLDTQGNEMDVLLGMEEYLRHFKYLCIELSATPIYAGETPGDEVARWLEFAGFTQDSPIVSHDDVFFVRHDIKPVSDRIYRGKA